MVYKRGDVSIGVYKLDGFGKNPSLWIGTDNPNQELKVASFGSEDKARLFCKWFEYIAGFNNGREVVKYDADGEA